MRPFLTIMLFICFIAHAIGQKVSHDSVSEREPAAVAELGGAGTWDTRNIGSSFGPNVAIEVTPIENWLELELGIAPSFGAHTKGWDIDLLFKKPWTLSPRAEFMFGVGLLWTRINSYNVTTGSLGGETALDFMFWPSGKHRFGWYLEPAYEYDFRKGHDQSIGISGGLLIGVP